ncbi:hypothetical protein NH26_04465 [Flammeovirga pacifica]|uniref:GSCFA domain-containing protein n=2 Tax=Flammeovirga pacifica TaxID=915059 RepID=A0A1S1Z577_FLAPC|nr:hypothetical protein NH26_04465 [Flammeovirga pacifica]
MYNETFRTPIKAPIYEKKINYKSKILSIGSCFSSNIGEKLKEYRFNILSNPFGTLFNPISIHQNLRSALHTSSLNNDHIISENNFVKSLDYHSDITSESTENFHQSILEKNLLVKNQMDDLDFLLITWGSSFVFEYNKTKKIVANCHKLPSKEFTQRLLSPEEIVLSFDELLSFLPKKTTILLTVSPIRHFRNGLTENNLSKSILRYTSHILEQKYSNVSYFPSFEIMTDELRDYRFYKEDMVHPTDQAILYIWDYVKNSLFNDSTKSVMEKWDKVLRGVRHKPINPDSEAHQNFLKKMITLCESINEIEKDDLILSLKEQIVTPKSH